LTAIDLLLRSGNRARQRARAEKCNLFVQRSSFRLDCENFLRRDGKVADAQASRVIDSIGDGGRHAGRTKLTDALGTERTRVGVEFIDESEWVARQITEAFPWNEAPRYLVRDRDRIYGSVVKRRLRAMGIRDKPITAASPWQNAFAEAIIIISERIDP
jgi:hypothetical protein